MKHVFSTDEVAHIWAQQKQDEGRNAQGNFYFEGKTIFSYGSHFPIATFLDDKTVLFTTRGYSPTTSRHIYNTRDAVSHFKRIDVYNPRAAVNTYEHKENLRKMLDAFAPEQTRALKSRLYFDDIKAGLIGSINSAAEYATLFKKFIPAELKKELKTWTDKVKKDSLFSDKEKERIKKQLAAALVLTKERNAARRAEDAKRAAELARTQEENLELWLKGGDISAYRLPAGVRLRVNGDSIETTRGASISLLAARALWRRFSKDPASVAGLNLGAYTVNAFEVTDNTSSAEIQGSLIVGCHRIPTAELYRMADVLKWRKNSEVIS